jgi:NAD(P)-dependent dehydrogenase (short-subunit alcohol dehydrogenase family)
MDGEKRVALVTGANRGLGFEICRQLAAKNHTVFLGCRDIDKGRVAADTLKSEGFDVRPISIDASKSRTILEAVKVVQADFGCLDVLINNAGTFVEEWGTMPSLLKLSELKETFDTNFFGPFEIIREFVPLMLKSSAARIVNISSDMGSLANINNPDSHVYEVMGPAYQASKSAINALTVLFAKEFTGTNFKVNSASPGWCRTDMGTEDAPLSVAEGAQTPVMLATLPNDGPTGEFFSSTRAGAKMEW